MDWIGSSKLSMVIKEPLIMSLFPITGNGKDSKFWDGIWLDDLSLKAQYPKLYALELHKDISVAEKRDSSLALFFRRPPRVGDEEEQYSHLLSRVGEVSLLCMLDR
ncbi:hypothetical protein Tco_1060017 [Tanacetum coccineum]